MVQKSCELGNPVASNAFSQTTALAIAYGHLLAIRDIRIPTLVTRSFYRVLHLRVQAPTIGSKKTHACSLAIFHPCCSWYPSKPLWILRTRNPNYRFRWTGFWSSHMVSTDLNYRLYTRHYFHVFLIMVSLWLLISMTVTRVTRSKQNV